MRAALAVLLPILVAGCGPEKLTSAWQDRAVDASGFIEDWSGATRTVADGELTVGALNDADRLYLYLHPESVRTAMSLYRQGFTIWLGEGDAKRGLRFPVEEPIGASSWSAHHRGEHGAPGASGEWDAEGRRGEGSREMRAPAPKLTVVDVLDADGEPMWGGGLGDVAGVSVVTSSSDPVPSVQVAIDLGPATGESVGVSAHPGDRVRVGLTTPELQFGRPPGGGWDGGRGRAGEPPGGDVSGGDTPDGGSPDGAIPDGGFPGGGPPDDGIGRSPGGGMPRGGGRGGHGGGPWGGGARPSAPKALDLSARITLATGVDRPTH
jgi:hypothetical protein